MPLAQLTIIEGRDDETKAELIANVTDAICETLNAPRESIRVLIQEIPEKHWGIGGRSFYARKNALPLSK